MRLYYKSAAKSVGERNLKIKSLSIWQRGKYSGTFFSGHGVLSDFKLAQRNGSQNLKGDTFCMLRHRTNAISTGSYRATHFSNFLWATSTTDPPCGVARLEWARVQRFQKEPFSSPNRVHLKCKQAIPYEEIARLYSGNFSVGIINRPKVGHTSKSQRFLLISDKTNCYTNFKKI